MSIATLIAVLLAGPSCARNGSYAPEEVAADLEPLYERIREYREDYERGIDLMLCGEDIAGRNMLTSASDRLHNATVLCTRTPGCSVELFNNALADVFAQRRHALALPEIPELPAHEEFPLHGGDSPVIGAIPEMGRTLALLHGQDLRERIPLNDRVKSALDDWLTWKRPQLIDAWEYYQFLRPKLAPIYQAAELPEALLFAILAKESGGKAHAFSSAGAAGPLQFMPRTARSYGLGSEDGFDMRLDPVAATRANAAYLNDQFEAFNHDLEKTLAAYNVGPTKLKRLSRKHSDAEFWDAPLFNTLPRETRDYVPQVLAAALLFLHPEEYELRFPVFEETASSTIELAEPMSLGELTICLGSQGNPEGWFRTLRNLNPRAPATRRLPAGEMIELPSFLVPGYAERCTGRSPLLRRAREIHDARHPKDTPVPRPRLAVR